MAVLEGSQPNQQPSRPVTFSGCARRPVLSLSYQISYVYWVVPGVLRPLPSARILPEERGCEIKWRDITRRCYERGLVYG